MKHIKNCTVIELDHVERVIRVPDEVGDLVSGICLRVFGEVYCLGCVDSSCAFSSTEESFIIVDDARATAFVLSGNESVTVFGFEDFEWIDVGEYVYFYSDAGLFVAFGRTVKWIDFSRLNEYFISIDFSKINDSLVGFDLGYGLRREFSIIDLGKLAVPLNEQRVEIGSRSGPLLVYDLDSTVRRK